MSHTGQLLVATPQVDEGVFRRSVDAKRVLRLSDIIICTVRFGTELFKMVYFIFFSSFRAVRTIRDRDMKRGVV